MKISESLKEGRRSLRELSRAILEGGTTMGTLKCCANARSISSLPNESTATSSSIPSSDSSTRALIVSSMVLKRVWGGGKANDLSAKVLSTYAKSMGALVKAGCFE